MFTIPAAITTSAIGTAAIAAHPAAWGHPGFGWWIVFPLFWIALIVLFIVGRRRGYVQHQHKAAETVLRERYARGEVDETEFRQRLEVLRGTGRG